MDFWLIGHHRGSDIRHRLSPGTCTVGRNETNDLCVPSQTVSRTHAELRVHEDAVLLTDLDSTNGTRVNDERLKPNDALRLYAGDTIEFGSVAFVLSDRQEPSEPAWADDGQICQSVSLTRAEVSDGELGLAAPDPKLFHLVTEAGQLLVLPGEPEKAFDPLLELVEQAIPADRLLMLLRNEDQEPVQVAARSKGTKALAPLVLSRTMVRSVLDEGNSLLLQDVQLDARFQECESILNQDLRSAMAVPLQDGEETLGVLYVDTETRRSWSDHDLRVLALLAKMAGTKIGNARRIEQLHEQERIQKDLERAKRIQERLLPQEMPEVPGYELAGSLDTSVEVGGDFYDAEGLASGRVQVALGDVSGKGMGAALLVSDVLATIRALRTVEMSPSDLVAHLDRHLLRRAAPEDFVTLFLAALDPVEHRLECVVAGHPSAFLVHPDGKMTELGATGGLVGGLMGKEFRSDVHEFPPGCNLIVYSDGVTEAQSASGEYFEDERLAAVFRKCAGVDANACTRIILDELDEFLQEAPRTDDVTLFVVRRME